MMTKKNLAKAVTLSLLLSTALSTNAWALEIEGETINSSSIAADNRFDKQDYIFGSIYISSEINDKISLKEVNLKFDSNFVGLAGVREIDGGTIEGQSFIIGNLGTEMTDYNDISISNIKLENNVTYGAFSENGSVSYNTVSIKKV